MGSTESINNALSKQVLELKLSGFHTWESALGVPQPPILILIIVSAHDVVVCTL